MMSVPRSDYLNREPVNVSDQRIWTRLYKLMGFWLVRGLDSIYLAIRVLRIRIFLHPIDLRVSTRLWCDIEGGRIEDKKDGRRETYPRRKHPPPDL
jgi:hypothetical protein